MRRTLTLLLLLAACPPLSAADTQLYREVVAPYVEVRLTPDGPGASGTCLKVGTELLVLTAGHVVEDALAPGKPREYRDAAGKPQKVVDPPSWSPVYLVQKRPGLTRVIRAAVVWYSASEEGGGHDLALLRPQSPDGFTPARTALAGSLDVGDACWYVGTCGGLHGCLERSLVSRLDDSAAGSEFTAVGGCGWYGNSGGGLYVKRGGHYALAGVVVRLHSPVNPKSPVLAQTPATVRRFLDDYLRQSRGKECRP